MQFIVTETENMAQFHIGVKTGQLNWQPTLAKTEKAAKAFAQSNRTFQRTIAHVAFITADSKIVPLFHRIDGKWEASE